MVTRNRQFTAILLVFLAMAVPPVFAQQTNLDNAQSALNNAYNAVVDASKSGIDTSNLIVQLNQAITLTSQAQVLINSNPVEAQNLTAQAEAIAQNVTSQALAAKANIGTIGPVTVGVSVALLLSCGCLVYFFGPRIFWGAWLKLRRNYQISLKKSSVQSKDFILTWEQVCAVILVATVIIAFLAVAPFFVTSSASEQFSELGVLGPNMQLSDYPSRDVAGQTVNLYGYVGNQMGQPMYYVVLVKLGDNKTTVDPASTIVIQQFASVVANNGTWTFPVSVTLTKVGYQRIIFELWIYNQTLDQMQYNQRWGQVWVNVTAPAG